MKSLGILCKIQQNNLPQNARADINIWNLTYQLEFDEPYVWCVDGNFNFLAIGGHFMTTDSQSMAIDGHVMT